MLRGKKIVLRDPDNNYRLPVLPDAYFEITDADGRVQCAMLEIDIATVTSGEAIRYPGTNGQR